jgi:hypothetical protein
LVVEPRLRQCVADQSLVKRSRLTPWILALSLVSVGVACGNSSPPTPDRPAPKRYVSVVCSAVLAWKNFIEVEASSVVTQAPSLKGANAYLKGVLELTDEMLARVRTVGAPATSNGPNLQREVMDRLAAARSALSRVQAGVATLLTQGSTALVREVELPILSAIVAIKSDLRNPSSPELARATVSNRDCHTMFRRKAPIGTGA